MRVLMAIWIWVLAPPAWSAETVLERLDHIYATSTDARAIYRLFTETLQLPAAWEFEDYGSFASGGVSLGNVVFEAIHRPGDEGPSMFSGIAYLPRQDAAATRAAFAQRDVVLSESRPYVDTSEGTEVVLWENITLSQLSSPAFTVFICDYKYRNEMNASRRAARKALVERGGGPLGVAGLHAIQVGAVDAPLQLGRWAAVLQGVEPRIEIVPDATDRILGVTLRVHSLAQAETWLRARGLLADGEAGSVEIERSAVQGLRFRLID